MAPTKSTATRKRDGHSNASQKTQARDRHGKPRKHANSSQQNLVGGRVTARPKAASHDAGPEDELADPGAPSPARQNRKGGNSNQADKRTHRVLEPIGQRERTATRLRKDFPRLKPKTRYVPQSVIKAKWPPLASSAQQQVREIFKAAKRPIVASRKDERRRNEAEIVLDKLVQRLEARLPNMPFPPKTKDLHFDLEKLLDRNRLLASQLTTTQHSVEVLEAEIEREERALERDQAILNNLETNAKGVQQSHKRRTAKMHPFLRDLQPVRTGEYEWLNVSSSARPLATTIDETDVDLSPIIIQLRNHLESIQTNVTPVRDLGSTVAQTHGTVQHMLGHQLSTQQVAGFGD